MCRLLVVKSTEPILLSQLLTAPVHSIINQASDARLRLDSRSINADGAGVGWYSCTSSGEDGREEEDCSPCIFRMITPAWSNQNLHRLAEKVKSPLVFAHVRASTTGALSEENCHPWRWGSLLWMHNGCIADFRSIIRKLQANLSDEYFNFPQGNTDSEWAFACFLQRLSKLTDTKSRSIPHPLLRQAMLETIALINSYTASVNSTEPSLMNFCVTDGVSVVCTRYISSKTEEAASLFFSTGSTFEEYGHHNKGGVGTGESEVRHFRMEKADKRENIVLVASEPLTFERSDWLEIPTQTLVVITPRNNFLRFPIVDEFFLSTPNATRSDSVARSKGYRWILSENQAAAVVEKAGLGLPRIVKRESIVC